MFGGGWAVFKLVIAKKFVPLLRLTDQDKNVLWQTFDDYPNQISEINPLDNVNVVFLIRENSQPVRNSKVLLGTRKRQLQHLLEEALAGKT